MTGGQGVGGSNPLVPTVNNRMNLVIIIPVYNSNSLHEALLNHFKYKLEHLLKFSDRNSMFFSIESRVPFLDNRLVERSLASSKNGKPIKSGWTKVMLRESMKGILIEDIRMRKDKIGFETPSNIWLHNNHFSKLIKDVLSSDRLIERNIFEKIQLKKLYKSYLNQSEQSTEEIWKILTLELWYRKFIDT